MSAVPDERLIPSYRHRWRRCAYFRRLYFLW